MRAALLSLALLGAFLAGCASTPKETVVPAPDETGQGWVLNIQEDTALFLATDDAIGKRIDLQGLTAYSNHEGGLKVACRLFNVTGKPLAIQLHALFRRADGTTLEEMPWRTVVLPVGRAIPFEAVNESGSAVRVLVEVRLAPGPGRG